MSLPEINETLYPFAKLMGVVVTRADTETVEAEMTVRAELCTSGEVLHGGAMMAFADSLGGLATSLSLPEDATGTATIESKTNFLAAAPVGTLITGETTPVHRGRTTMVWQTRISAESGRLVAIVTQTQLVLAPR